NQDLRRGSYDMKIVEVPVVEVGGGVKRAQGPIEGEGRVTEGFGDDLTDLHLHQIARRDVFLGLEDGCDVVLLGEVAALGGLHACVGVRDGERCAQLLA